MISLAKGSDEGNSRAIATITTPTTPTTTTTTTETITQPIMNQAELRETISNLYNQIGGFTIGIMIVGIISAVSIVLLVFILRRPTE